MARRLNVLKARLKKSHFVLASIMLVSLAKRQSSPDWTALMRARLSAKRGVVRVDRGGTCRGNFPKSSAELILPVKSPLRKRRSC